MNRTIPFCLSLFLCASPVLAMTEKELCEKCTPTMTMDSRIWDWSCGDGIYRTIQRFGHDDFPHVYEPQYQRRIDWLNRVNSETILIYKIGELESRTEK